MGPVEDQLDADEAEDRRQAVGQVHQLAEGPLEHEVQRAQAEQGEGVGGEDEVGVAGDAVDRRHGVDREDHVGGEDRDHDQGERRQPATTLASYDEARAVVVVGHGHDPPCEAHDPHLVDVDLVVVAGDGVAQQLEAGQQQDAAEHQEDPVEPVQGRGAQGDEDAPQDEGADDAVEEHPLLERLGDGEGGEQQHEDEQVVDAQGLLDQVAGVVLQATVGAVGVPDVQAEQEGEGDVERRPGDGLPHRHLVGLAGGDEVHRQQGDDGADGDPPQGRGRDGVQHGGSPRGSQGQMTGPEVSLAGGRERRRRRPPEARIAP